MNDYIILLKSFNSFFYRQARILKKEIKTIKYATNYYRKFKEYYENNYSTTLGQDFIELEIIYDGIKSIENKADKLLKQLVTEEAEDNQKDSDEITFLNIINKVENNIGNNHLTILPIIDEKINQFKILFDELNFYKQSYFNLVDSKEFSYIPSPKFNKRFRNANLGLYLNKQLNDTSDESYKIKISNFYKINNFAYDDQSIENFKNTNFFATWSYTTEHYIKDFKSINKTDEKNIYISMSYAYLDKTILQPIAYHEISHIMKHKKLSNKDSIYLEESLKSFNRNDIFVKRNPLDKLYKEILCDLSAVYASGISYIISLVHVGFFELEDLFSEYKDYEISTNDEEPNKLFDIRKNEDIIPNSFDYNINNIELAVRLLILIKLCDKLGIKNTYINGIKYMLNILFPSDNFDNGKATLLTIYDFTSEYNNDYIMNKNLIYSLYEKFQNIILTRNLIENFKNITSEKSFDSFIKNCKDNNNDVNDIFKKYNNTNMFKSIYDFLWISRENKIYYNTDDNKDKIRIHERELNRLYNIYSLLFYDKTDNNQNLKQEIISNFFDKDKKQFYDLEFIKYKSKEKFQPFIEFIDNKANDKSPYKVSYAFAPYDLVLLKEVDYSIKLDEYFKNYPFIDKSKKEEFKYFIDRHSLFLLKELPEKETTSNENKTTSNENKTTSNENNNIFNLITQIKIPNVFNKDDNNNLLNFLIKYLQNNKKFNTCKIFKSLGIEDYLIYFENLTIEDTKYFGKYLKVEYTEYLNKKGIGFKDIQIEDIILLNNNATPENIKDIEFASTKIISFAKINSRPTDSNSFYKHENNMTGLPDDEDCSDIKIPTNRFDCIINWKENNNDVLHRIYIHLKNNYGYNEKDTQSGNHEYFYSDFNIEMMHSKTIKSNDKSNIVDINK